MIREVEIMLDAGADGGSGTLRPVGEKFDSTRRVGYDQGLSSRTVSRYLCVNRLIPRHKKRLDSGAISMRTAVSLSYLSDFEQELVDEVLTACHCRLSLTEADALRAAKRPLTEKTIHEIIQDPNCADQPATAKAFKLSPETLARYFTPEQTADEIESVIIQALDKYFNK